MNARWVAAGVGFALVSASGFSIGCATAVAMPTPTATADSQTVTITSEPLKRRENPQIGFTLMYPADWEVTGGVVATDFQKDAQCESIRIVDFQPPPDSGSASIQQSFVQICAKPLTDDLPLDQFLARIYPEADAARFQPTELAGMRARETMNANGDATIYLQTDRSRIQIVTAVVAEPDLRSARRMQVQRILASISFP